MKENEKIKNIDQPKLLLKKLKVYKRKSIKKKEILIRLV